LIYSVFNIIFNNRSALECQNEDFHGDTSFPNVEVCSSEESDIIEKPHPESVSHILVKKTSVDPNNSLIDLLIQNDHDHIFEVKCFCNILNILSS
jgi:hypothetical protein